MFYQSPLELRPPTVGEVPKIHIPQLFRILRKSPHALIQWSTRNNIIGTATAEIADSILSVKYLFLDYSGHHFINLDIPGVSDGSIVLRNIAECPKCSRDVRIIYFHLQVWRCRRCSNIGYDSQRRALGDDRGVLSVQRQLVSTEHR